MLANMNARSSALGDALGSWMWGAGCGGHPLLPPPALLWCSPCGSPTPASFCCPPSEVSPLSAHSDSVLLPSVSQPRHRGSAPKRCPRRCLCSTPGGTCLDSSHVSRLRQINVWSAAGRAWQRVNHQDQGKQRRHFRSCRSWGHPTEQPRSPQGQGQDGGEGGNVLGRDGPRSVTRIHMLTLSKTPAE